MSLALLGIMLDYAMMRTGGFASLKALRSDHTYMLIYILACALNANQSSAAVTVTTACFWTTLQAHKMSIYLNDGAE